MTLQAKPARNWLAAMVIGGILVSVVSLALASRGGAISAANVDKSLAHLGTLYGAPLAVILGFYFGTANRATSSNGQVPVESFILALLLTGIYVFAPAVLVWEMPIERLLALIDNAAPYPQSLSSLVLAYFFTHY